MKRKGLLLPREGCNRSMMVLLRCSSRLKALIIGTLLGQLLYPSISSS